jgi:hypothetical protein
MAQDPLVRREPVSGLCNRQTDESLETQKYSLYPKEHPANCTLRWRLSNGLGVYLSWLQAGFSHHTRQSNWWSVHQRRLATSCYPPLTGCEWHLFNHTLQCPVVTIRCYPWSAGSWKVFHIVGLCVFSHQSADYSIVVAHLTSNSFEGHPCCMHADYLPSLCFWYSPSCHAYWEWIIFFKTPVSYGILNPMVNWPSPVLKQHWLPNRRLSTRTVRNRLKSAGLKSRSH